MISGKALQTAISNLTIWRKAEHMFNMLRLLISRTQV